MIRAINAPYFLGTKVEAFNGRGKRDYLASHDLEDFIAGVGGRRSLITEVESASSELKMYIADSVRLLLSEPHFLDTLPGYLLPDGASQARIGQLLSKLRRLGMFAKLPSTPSGHHAGRSFLNLPVEDGRRSRDRCRIERQRVCNR